MNTLIETQFRKSKEILMIHLCLLQSLPLHSSLKKHTSFSHQRILFSISYLHKCNHIGYFILCLDYFCWYYAFLTEYFITWIYQLFSIYLLKDILDASRLRITNKHSIFACMFQCGQKFSNHWVNVQEHKCWLKLFSLLRNC